MKRVLSVLMLVVGGASVVCGAGEQGGGSAVPVEIRREGDGFRLYRGGAPYYIEGAVYWARPDGRYPLSGLAARGANSVRCGGRNVPRILDAAQRLGMSATVGLKMKMEAVHGFDYDDAEAVAEQFEQMREIVLRYKDHPAVLIWAVGNELSMNYKNRRVWDAVNDVAEMIHRVDPRHPTMTVIGGGSIARGDIKEIIARCPAIDILGVNYYKGIEEVPAKVRADGWSKPYCITEWGPSGHWQVPKTQWKACIEETSTEKAERYLERYRAVMEKDRQMCLGSYVFFWGQKQERTHTWYGMFLPGGERTGAVGVMQYVWTGQWPENRAPRVSRLRIEGGTAEESIHLKAGQEYAARVEASDPDADALAFEYEVLAEQTTFGYGGMGERRPATLDGLVRSQDGGEMRFVAPAKEGAYRLFVYVRDGKGAAATANAPFYVKP